MSDKKIFFFSIILTLLAVVVIYVYLFPQKAVITIDHISIQTVKMKLDDQFERNSLLGNYGVNIEEIEGRETDLKIVRVDCTIRNIGFKEITLPYMSFSPGQVMPSVILGNRVNRLDREGVTPISFMEDIELSFGILVCSTDDNQNQIIKELENLDVCVIDYNKPYTDYEKCNPISNSVKLVGSISK